MSTDPQIVASSLQTADTPTLELLTDPNSRDLISGGRLLLEIAMSQEEVTAHRHPPPLFCHPLRTEYLVDLYAVVRDHFKTFVPPLLGAASSSDSVDCPLWFDICMAEERSIPLNWSTPLGVLFDLYGPPVREGVLASMPWRITAHFMYYPSPQSLPEFKTCDQFSSLHFNQMKAAIAIQLPRHAPTAFGLMLTADVQRLRRRDPRILNECVDSKELRNASSRKIDEISRVPLKIYVPSSSSVLLYSSNPCFTVSQLLSEIDASRMIPIVHGIHISEETPLWWLMLHASCTDLFVHIVLRDAGEDDTF
ncbi:autophagy protein 5 [Perkinsus olseni]|uniref:Autophagy protein 5 n=3 Tax=Perkinsus olseni TaxID=32597 RepID=A0A7J6NMM0_PEROL|nr:autophagy protein 5 [Perkinsus olseni]